MSDAGEREFRLDVEVEASGFSHHEARQLFEARLPLLLDASS